MNEVSNSVNAAKALREENERMRNALGVAVLELEEIASAADRKARHVKELLRDLQNECDN